MLMVFVKGKSRKRNVSYSRKRNRPQRALTVNDVKRIARGEATKKEETKVATFGYSSLSLNSVSSSGTTSYLANLITQGVTSSTRVGDQIDFRGFRFYLPLQPGDNTNYLRLAFLMPKRAYPYGGTVAELIEDILEGNSNWYDPINTDKYSVLYDKTFSMYKRPLDGSSATSLTDVTKFAKGFIKVNKRIKWEYNAITNATGPLTDVIMFAISDSAAVSHPGAVGGFVRVYYKDA